MGCNRRTAPSLRALAAAGLLAGLGALALPAPPVSAEAVMVARGRLHLEDGPRGAGLVFFLPSEDPVGAVAVGAAHSFEPELLARAGEIEFRRAGSGQRISVSSRYLAEPGRAFFAGGATLREDYVVFALDVRPRDVRVLEPAKRLPEKGSRVRIVGAPEDGSANQTDVFGTVVKASETRLEVDLDTPEDLRGWGGAPVLALADDERVVGILQAAWPAADTLRVGAAPLGGVMQALANPLDAGRGREFAAHAAPTGPGSGDGASGRARQTDRERDRAGSPPDAERARTASRRPSPAAPGPRRRGAGAVQDDRGVADDARARRADDEGRETLSLTGGEDGRDATGQETTRLQMEIEHPKPDTVIGSAAGAFLAGRAIALRGDMKRFDVVFVLDTSQSTAAPTGVDVDGDGRVGQPPLGPVGQIFGMNTDAGDSILAAEVAAARKILSGLDPRSTRVGVVTFAGEPAGSNRGFFGSSRVVEPALTVEPLTRDYERVERALERVLSRGPRGMTHMAAGVDQATVELLGLSGSLSKPDAESEKAVLFFTDGQPTLPYQGLQADNVRAVLRAAQRAQRAGLRIHSFAIGPDALNGPIAPVEMASVTDGSFTPVRNPGGLVTIVEGVSFANIDRISVHNATNGEEAHYVRSHADGSWDALVPLEPGKNRIEVTALASDGSTASEELTLHYAPDAEDPYVPRELVAKRNALLERRLVEIRRARVVAEREAAEETRRELALEIERERAKAKEAAAKQRKELDLEPAPTAP